MSVWWNSSEKVGKPWTVNYQRYFPCHCFWPISRRRRWWIISCRFLAASKQKQINHYTQQKKIRFWKWLRLEILYRLKIESKTLYKWLNSSFIGVFSVWKNVRPNNYRLLEQNGMLFLLVCFWMMKQSNEDIL